MDQLLKSLNIEGGIPVQKMSIIGKNADGTYNLYIRYEDGYEVLPKNASSEQVIQFYRKLSPNESLYPYVNIVRPEQNNKYYRPPGQYQADYRYQDHFNIYD